MKVEIDGIEYIEKPKAVVLSNDKSVELSADNDIEAAKLYYAYEPLCPECGYRAFPTNFPPSSFGGDKNSKRVVWICSDMGHCAFSITSDIKWQKKKEPKEPKEGPFDGNEG